MKKNIAIFLSFIFLAFQAAKAEVSIGLTGALHMFDVSGTETTRQSGQKNNGSHSDEVLVPELFIESQSDNFAVGLSYIPTRDMGYLPGNQKEKSKVVSKIGEKKSRQKFDL